jgi:hypothetical protein
MTSMGAVDRSVRCDGGELEVDAHEASLEVIVVAAPMLGSRVLVVRLQHLSSDFELISLKVLGE